MAEMQRNRSVGLSQPPSTQKKRGFSRLTPNVAAASRRARALGRALVRRIKRFGWLNQWLLCLRPFSFLLQTARRWQVDRKAAALTWFTLDVNRSPELEYNISRER